jgi:predicted double-glycine peptidase
MTRTSQYLSSWVDLAAAAMRAATLCLFACLLLWSGKASASDVSLSIAEAGNYNLHVISYSEIPFRTVIRQKFDYSCGSAALATLLKYHYAFETDEIKVFKFMYDAGDQDRIKKLGFSLLDMKKYLLSLGYHADGYHLSIQELAQAGIPAIALVQIGSYKHFVVIKGIVSGHILVGDPASGLREMPSEDFSKIWNGVAFLIHDAPKGDAAAIFNSADEWRRWSEAHPLSAATINIPLTPLLRDLRVIYQIEPNQILPNPFQP